VSYKACRSESKFLHSFVVTFCCIRHGTSYMFLLHDPIRGFHSIGLHNVVVDRGGLQAMCEELAGHVVHRDVLIIC